MGVYSHHVARSFHVPRFVLRGTSCTLGTALSRDQSQYAGVGEMSGVACLQTVWVGTFFVPPINVLG